MGRHDGNFVLAVAIEVTNSHAVHLLAEALGTQSGAVAGARALIAELRVQVDVLLCLAAGFVHDDVGTAGGRRPCGRGEDEAQDAAEGGHKTHFFH